MSPVAPMIPAVHAAAPRYMSTSTDALNRHDYGVQKSRKQASTGGGRAWSEDEEVYLLQTRLQKMPYKHIAAHLKKTELACRLHYHQLSHGSNRRKRSSSATPSESSVKTNSPTMSSAVLSYNMPSPIHEHSVSPPSSSHGYSSNDPAHIQLPSASTLLCQSQPPNRTPSPRQSVLGHPIAILPKPSATGVTPPLRLVTPSTVQSGSHYPFSHQGVATVDYKRLRQIYESHRSSIWSTIAAEYGNGMDACTLEEAWRQYASNPNAQGAMPPTPCVSPDTHTSSAALSGGNYYQPKLAAVNNATPSPQMLPAIPPTTESNSPKTSISSLLGIDASPRSPEERELVRQMEERRGSRVEVM